MFKHTCNATLVFILCFSFSQYFLGNYFIVLQMKQTFYCGEKKQHFFLQIVFRFSTFTVFDFLESHWLLCLHNMVLMTYLLLFETKLQLLFWFNKKMMRSYTRKFNADEGEQIPVMSVTDKISLPEMPQGILCAS